MRQACKNLKRWFRRRKRQRLKEQRIARANEKWQLLELELQKLRLFHELEHQRVSEYLFKRKDEAYIV